MTDLNLTPRFKYITLICCQVRDIFSIYISTGAISVHENYQHVEGWNPTTLFFPLGVEKWQWEISMAWWWSGGGGWWWLG